MPARLKDILRAAKTLGLDAREPNSGSHYMVSKPGCLRPYPLSAHNGMKTEIEDKYIRGLCRAMGLDEAEFRALL